MRLCHTSLTELTTNFADNYDGNTPQVVCEADPLQITVPTDGWIEMPDFASFSYDGADNLLIEIVGEGDNTMDAATWAWDSGANRIVSTDDPSSPTGKLGTRLNRFRLTIEPDIAIVPASWGVIKAGL